MLDNTNKNIKFQDNYNISDYDKSSNFTSNSNTDLVVFGLNDCEPILRTNKELEKRFVPKKKETYHLANCYDRIGETNRAVRVRDCGTFLEFARAYNESKVKLYNANFCRDRLCPLCSWRRSYKIYAQVSKIMDKIENDFDFVFLTLTVPNVTSDELSDKITQMQKAFEQMFNFDKRIKKACAGYFKALEVTHNKKRFSKSFDTYHPHFHVILAMDKGYCSSKNYIKQSVWLDIWRRVMHDDSITQVDVRMCKNKSSAECQDAEKSLSSAVSEVAKYSVKSNDYIISWSEDLTDRSVKTFLTSLRGRRLCSFGGIFKQVRKALELDDCENGDLVHFDNDKIRADVALQIYRFGWSCGTYKLIAIEKKESVLIEYDEEN